MLGIYEGVGRILGIATYVLMFIAALVGGLIFWSKENKKMAVWWVSVMANFIVFAYLLGRDGDLIYAAQIWTMIAWPIINIAWLLDMIRDYFKKRKNKNK